MVHGLFGKKKMRIDQILAEEQIDEGRFGKIAGAVAIIASLWGVNAHLAKQAYEGSPQLQKLTQYYELAKERGDEDAMKDLKQRIGNHELRIDLGYGEVMGPDGKPIVPQYDSEYRASQDKRRD